MAFEAINKLNSGNLSAQEYQIVLSNSLPLILLNILLGMVILGMIFEKIS